MIKNILDLLQCDDWINSGSPVIEFAKGSQELPKDWKGVKRKIKRRWQSRKR